MTQFINGIQILPENIQLLRIMPTTEIGEVMKAVFLHATGIEPDEELLSSDKTRLTYEIIRNQVDAAARRQRRGAARYIPEQAGGERHG